MTSLYTKYFQKSRVFLYPFLSIPKTLNYNPVNTYLSWKDDIHYTDYKLLVEFDKIDDDSFRAFEKQMFFRNPLFENYFECEKNKNIYIFDYSSLKEDWDNLLIGKYSKLSNQLKDAIKNHYGVNTANWVYIKSYLYPSNYYNIYAELLTSNRKDFQQMLLLLRNLEELCDKFNEDLEDCKLVKVKKDILNNIIN